MPLQSPPGLGHLCEFIEDCEHVELATQILQLLGREGPRTPTPYKYIRFIYNRVLLETAPVRAGGCGHVTRLLIKIIDFLYVCMYMYM